jgi:hypothetical protein
MPGLCAVSRSLAAANEVGCARRGALAHARLAPLRKSWDSDPARWGAETAGSDAVAHAYPDGVATRSQGRHCLTASIDPERFAHAATASGRGRSRSAADAGAGASAQWQERRPATDGAPPGLEPGSRARARPQTRSRSCSDRPHRSHRVVGTGLPSRSVYCPSASWLYIPPATFAQCGVMPSPARVPSTLAGCPQSLHPTPVTGSTARCRGHALSTASEKLSGASAR